MSDLAFKVRAPLGLTLPGGEALTIDNWSLQGIDLPSKVDVLPTAGELSIPFQGVDIRFPVAFEADPETGFLTFKGLTGRQRETLAVFYRSILSGRMASTEDIITSLDTPVDLVPMEETEEEKSEGTAGKTPRSLRAVWNVILYLMIAGFVFHLLGTQIWSRLTTISVTNARVTAQLVDHHAAEAGYVDKLHVAIGDTVRKGQRLVSISNPEHRGELDDLRQDIARMKKRVKSAEAALKAFDKGAPAARLDLERALRAALAQRRVHDFFGHYTLQEVERILRALHAFDRGMSLAEDDFMAHRAALYQSYVDLKTAYSRLKRDLSAAKKAGGAADILASADGVVTSVDVFRNQFAARGQLAVTVDEDAPRVVTGWLDQTYATVVHAGMRARLDMTAEGRDISVHGRVADVMAMADPERPGYFGLRISVLPQDIQASERNGLFRPDAPVMLILERNIGWLNFTEEAQNVRP